MGCTCLRGPRLPHLPSRCKKNTNRRENSSSVPESMTTAHMSGHLQSWAGLESWNTWMGQGACIAHPRDYPLCFPPNFLEIQHPPQDLAGSNLQCEEVNWHYRLQHPITKWKRRVIKNAKVEGKKRKKKLRVLSLISWKVSYTEPIVGSQNNLSTMNVCS